MKGVDFYQWDGTTDFATGEGKVKGTTGALISANASGIPTSGTIAVYFPNVGTDNESNTQNYNKAAANVTAGATSEKAPTFGTLANFQGKETSEADGSYLGRNLTQATFAGDVNAKYYKTVFPVSSSDPLTLRVDYTLVSTDGSGEEIKIYGAKAVVPSTYTKWLPNYAYTYIFKISDNTNGWTDPTGADPAGLFPITFDAVVTEATDVTGEQTTITTVATPSITTYQQGHNYETNEYSKAGNKLYVQVMNNKAVPATLVNDLNGTTSESTNRSRLFLVSDDNATEAKVMETLQKRTNAINATDVTGRNGVTLTNRSEIINTVTSIVNGVDNNAITEVTAGTAAEINIANLTALNTYAYVYDYTSGAKNIVTEYQPMDVSGGTVGSSGNTYYSITTAALATAAETPANITTAGSVENDYVYFSVTKNGTGTTTYSYFSVAGKTTVPAGLLKIAKSTIEGSTTSGGTSAATNTFYFEKYFSNDGKYAVKVIKVVD